MSILFNLSFAQSQPTGTAIYGYHLLRHLNIPNLQVATPTQIENYNCHITNKKFTTQFGRLGHLKRLFWLNAQLPKIYNKTRAGLFFSPVPEAPLCSKAPFVITIHDLIPLRFASEKSPSNLYFRYYVPLLLKNASCIICNSISTAEDVLTTYRIPDTKVFSIPLGYDTQHFRPLALPTKNYFLYVGRHNPHKNLERLITAFSKLRCHDIELWLAGPTDKRYTPNLRKCIAALGLCDRVKILGYVPYETLPALYNQAISFVFPSLWEGFGLPVLEAMACGTPVITSNLSALPEVTGKAAMLINPYDINEITSAMQLTFNNKSLRTSMQKKGLNRAKNFSWKHTGSITKQTIQAYS